jgi:hypothetical protein
MPLSQWNLEFLNHNAQRSYPLTAESTKQDTTQTFTIPNDFLVGLDIPVSAAMDMVTGQFFIRQVGLFASGVQLVVAYATDTGYMDVASALIPTTGSTIRNKVFTLGGIEPFDDIVGKVVIGRIDSLQAQPSGLFTFNLEDTRIEPQVVRPMIKGITSFRVASATGATSDRFYGDIELVAGSNIQLSAVSAGSYTRIVISAISGAGTIQSCSCEGEAATLPCIKTINGIAPGTDGNFNLVGDNCLSIDTTSNGIKMTDSCSQPCCGCPELEEITRSLENMSAQRATLETFVNQLAATTATFNSTVLGARLGDRRCLTCS